VQKRDAVSTNSKILMMMKKNKIQMKTKSAMMTTMSIMQLVLYMKRMKMDLMLRILPIILRADYHSMKTMVRSLAVK
jgi:hypothetical protein